MFYFLKNQPFILNQEIAVYHPEMVEKNDNRTSKSPYMRGFGQTPLADYQTKLFVFLDTQLEYISQSLVQLGEAICLGSCQ